MTLRNKLKIEIDRLDEQYLELLYKIVCQFPHVSSNAQEEVSGQEVAVIFQEIADAGGLGIKDPLEWQREIRQDRSFPLR